MYSLATSAAYATDSNLPPKTPVETGTVTPAPAPGPKPLSKGTKGIFVGGASAICGDALQTFILVSSLGFSIGCGRYCDKSILTIFYDRLSH